MTDKILYHTPFLNLVERDGWYYFCRIPGSKGGVILLLYRQGYEKSILGRYEICPAHNDGLALTTIAGGIEEGDTPLETAIKEAYEEAGYRITEFIELGQCNLSTNQDTIVYLFAADVTNLPQYEAPGDGTKGEEGAYCDWVTPQEAVMSKSAYMGTLVSRLYVKTGVMLE